jgi:hypothetical protein
MKEIPVYLTPFNFITKILTIASGYYLISREKTKELAAIQQESQNKTSFFLGSEE